MSKIPQGEWNAIAARHARGETIAKIAHDYGCTAPAIHYILKRQKERAGPVAVGTAGAPAAAHAAAPIVAAPPPSSSLRPVPELRPAAQVRPAAELRPARTDEPRRDRAPVFTIGPAAGERRLHEPQPERPGDRRPEQPRPAARSSALKAGLDTELQNQMEGAIETFRTHLNAALTERSPARCEELRAAASDLMRMTARTLIVLDRLGATHDQSSGRAPDYPRSAHAR